MKKFIAVLVVLFMAPLTVFADDINTSFDSDTCELTVSGELEGHDAVVSLFHNNNFLVMQTGPIGNNEYSVKFVLKYDAATTIDVAVEDEVGTQATKKSKTGVEIPACTIENNNQNEDPGNNPDPPDKILELFDGNNSIIMNDDTVGFGDHDVFNFDNMTMDDINQFLDALDLNNPDDLATYEMVNMLVDTTLDQLGDNKEFAAILNVHLRNTEILDQNNDPTEIDFSNYDGGFTLNVFIPHELFEQFQGLKFAILDEATLSLGEPLDYTYDADHDIAVLQIDRQCMIVAYLDAEYEYLDETGNQTYYKSEGGPLSFRIGGNLTAFQKLLIDGNEVDPSNYDLSEGSTIITLKASYAQSLSVGSHTVTALFNNGTATTNLTVANAPASNPGTVDNIMVYVELLIIGLFGLSMCGLMKNSKE